MNDIVLGLVGIRSQSVNKYLLNVYYVLSMAVGPGEDKNAVS